MGFWTLDDIPWHRFDRAKVDPEILRIVKAASLVEENGGGYARYLCGVFHDDPVFQDVARRWGAEEIQHGQVLGRSSRLRRRCCGRSLKRTSPSAPGVNGELSLMV
jgi:hypothetical protein